MIRRRRVKHSCRACQGTGLPLTRAQFCASCADVVRLCLHGDGERVGLPVPADVAGAAAVLEAHYLGRKCRKTTCLVCALLALADTCPECGARSDDHLKVGARVVVGCTGFVTSAVRAAALL